MSTVITEAGPCEVAGANVEGEQLWLQAADAERATGWSLKPEGLCQGDVCVPVPRAAAADYVRGDEVNMAAFWRLLERPVLHDHAGATWMLGAGATERAAALQSLTAPDFTLPDLSGQLHKLSDFRGKRVFLTTWSSW
jgi:hypothetical protein